MIVFEISNSWVKVLWAKSVLKDIQVSGMMSRPLSADSPEEIARVISSGVGEKVLKAYKPIVLCVPRNQATLRNLKFPSKDKGELDNIMNLHLTQQVPYSREDIIYNYTVLGRTAAGFSEVILGIIHRELLVKQFALFEKLNIYLENVQLSTSGLMRFLRKARVAREGDKELKACLDIDAEFSDFVIFKGREILFSKSIAIGSTLLRQTDKVPKFIGELRQAMVVFQTERRENISQFYVSGAVEENRELEKSISATLNLPVEAIDTLSVVSSLKEIKGAKDILRRASACALLGVAMEPLSEELNFTLPEAKLRKDVRDMTKNLVVLGCIIVYLIVLLLLGFAGKVYGRQAYLNKLTKEISALEVRNKDSIEAMDKTKAVRNFTRDTDSFLYYYRELTKIMPENITVNRLIFGKKDEFSMVGEGSDMGGIFNFVKVLSKAKTFGKVELRYSRKNTRGALEFNEFEIMCHLE